MNVNNKSINYYSFTIIFFILFACNPLYAQSFRWEKVSAGGEYSVALRSDGTLWSWGGNVNGQLGVIVADHQYSPVQIGRDTNWVDVEAGGFHALAVKKDGTLCGWGGNQVNQLGIPASVTQADTPVQIGTETNWASVEGGYASSYAIKKDGSLWAWGFNSYGQTGTGTSGNIENPTRIGMENNWIKIAAGGAHALALKNDGTLWAWGMNMNGQLGLGSLDSTSVPMQIGTAADWADVAAGFEWTLALKNDGTLWSWGFNGNGQLGQGNTTSFSVPTQIGSLDHWRKIGAGGGFGFAITADSALYGWGFNQLGALGDNTATQRNSPVRIGTESNWTFITGAEGIIVQSSILGLHSLGMKNNGEFMCASGANYVGQLGVNSAVNMREFNCNVVIRTTDIDETPQTPEKEKFIAVYPNPASGIVNIQLETSDLNINENKLIRVKNINGQAIYTETVTAGQTKIKLDLQTYPKGIYFIEYISNNSYYTEKLILQ